MHWNIKEIEAPELANWQDEKGNNLRGVMFVKWVKLPPGPSRVRNRCRWRPFRCECTNWIRIKKSCSSAVAVPALPRCACSCSNKVLTMSITCVVGCLAGPVPVSRLACPRQYKNRRPVRLKAGVCRPFYLGVQARYCYLERD